MANFAEKTHNVYQDVDTLAAERVGDAGNEIPSGISEHFLEQRRVEKQLEPALGEVDGGVDDGERIQEQRDEGPDDRIQDQAVERIGTEGQEQSQGEAQDGFCDTDERVDAHPFMGDDGGVEGG